jgi:hypothetical protein
VRPPIRINAAFTVVRTAGRCPCAAKLPPVRSRGSGGRGWHRDVPTRASRRSRATGQRPDACRAQKPRIGPVTRSFFEFDRSAPPRRPRWGMGTVHRARHLFRKHRLGDTGAHVPCPDAWNASLHDGRTAGQSGWVSNFPAGCSVPKPPGAARSSKLVLGFWAGLNQPRRTR